MNRGDWIRNFLLLFLAVFLGAARARGQEKPRVTLDEFFNFVHYTDVRASPSGDAVAVAITRADWKENRFRKEIWLYRSGNSSLTRLTESGSDWAPQWSPDGRWIAFLSEREAVREPETGAEKSRRAGGASARHGGATGRASENAAEKKKKVTQLYAISAAGGEAFPVTSGREEVHAFAWSADSSALYFATRIPWSKAQREAYRKKWKDVIQYRESERGDAIARMALAEAIRRRDSVSDRQAAEEARLGQQAAASGGTPATPGRPVTAGTPGSTAIATTPLRVRELAASPDGRTLAFSTESPSERNEGVQVYEIFLADARGGAPRPLTHNQAIEQHLRWSPDSRRIFFAVQEGSVEGKYEDVQGRVYSVNAADGAVERWAATFPGALTGYAVAADGSLVAAGRVGTEVQIYTQRHASARPDGVGASFGVEPGWPGTYSRISAAAHPPRIAFVYSSLERPTEVYLAEGPGELRRARAITSFNRLFTERELPRGRPYSWKADDGTRVEGMLLYPPGKFGAQRLPMFTLIHGGPEDADGNQFGADWYDWAILAASRGWLVFRPNYRGSTGYGDAFMRQIVPQIVSRPGKDILEGIDALVRDGIADPERLVVGGYSYGGYMTNWLITQTTRFRAAVTGAGAIEHAANWGNDDLTFDDAYFLGGAPWEAEKTYNDEAALWQINKVATPTHMVAGADDIRVSVLEDYLLERALHTLGVPSTLLVFPGEGHSLNKNPWHGKIKVREELAWLEKYGAAPRGGTLAPAVR